MNKDFCENLLRFLYPYMIDALRLKTVEIRVSFIPIQARKNFKSWYRQVNTIFCVVCDNFE